VTTQPELPFDLAGHALEREVPAAERHTRGQYFTPGPLIRFVFDRLDEVGQGPASGSLVLDPACGSGRFLGSAARRWAGLSLRGYETDPAALAIARGSLPGASIAGTSFLDAPGRGDVDLVVGNPPYLRDRGAKRDVYVDFVEKAFDHLRPGGVLALVLSNAWLDVEYGAAVRRVLLSRSRILWLVESGAERWFPGAKVHTMVLVAQRADGDGDVRLGATREALPAPPEVRVRRQSSLPDEAWGPLLRASDEFLALRDRGVPLGELFDVRRGFTTNDNAFFYPPADAGIEASASAPVFRSPKRVASVRAVAEELPDRVFLGGPDDGPGAAAWVKARHPDGAPRLPRGVSSRQFLLKGYAARFRQPLFDRPVLCDQQLYAVTPREGVEVSPEAVAGLLNSTWMHLSLEYTGRVNFGDGVLWLGLRDARSRLRIPDLRRASARVLDAIADGFRGLPDGPVPPISRLYADAAWAGPMDVVDAAVSDLLGIDSTATAALRAELVARTATRTG